MIKKGIVSSLDALMNEIIGVAKSLKPFSEKSVVWEISGKIAYVHGRKAFWTSLKETVLQKFSSTYDGLIPFVVRDLSFDSY